MMKLRIGFAALALCAGATALQALAISVDPPVAADTDSGPAEAAADAVREEFVPPPGFVRKQRGKFVLYCKRDAVIGTRVKTEACYDEQQVRDYLLAMKESKESVDNIRNRCGNVCVCGSPELCNPTIRQPRGPQ
jgi:hypothetical protein